MKMNNPLRNTWLKWIYISGYINLEEGILLGYNQNLYRELLFLRQKLKEEGRKKTGRAPLVCSDEALYEMVNLIPKKLSDFSVVPGLGQTFIDQYGDIFLKAILLRSQVPTEQSVQISTSSTATLKELEKKLVSINKRNRLLYMPKIANKYAFDLYDGTGKHNPLKIIFGKEAGEIICDISEVSSSKVQDGADKYRRVVQLIREVNKDLRDKGQNDFFIGYPFVQGRLAGEDFNIRAPLALFPVNVEREAQYIKVVLDNSRDIVFNNTLLLAHYKFNNINRPLPSPTIEEIITESFIQKLLAFYKEHGLDISNDDADLSKFKEYNAAEFPHYTSGDLRLVQNIVLGKFPTYSSSIQKDFNDILDTKEINSLVNDLISGIDDVDYYSDSYSGQEEIKIQDIPLTISEQALFYINDLNSAQETVLAAAQKFDELVVQGPPGTGKSQTITSLITEFINAGKTVLMVSEKKTALDVVYSRLGDLSKYTLLIDDIGNKDLFYSQLNNMLQTDFRNASLEDVDAVSRSIDDNILRLDSIAKKLYAVSDFGIEPYKLYLMNRRIDLANPHELEEYRQNKDFICELLMQVDYETLEEMHQTFSEVSLTDNLSLYFTYCENSPWLNSIKEDMSKYEIILFSEKLGTLILDINTWKAKNPLNRLFTKNKLKRKVNNLVHDYFYKQDKQTVKLMFEFANEIKKSLEYYDFFIEKKPLFNNLTEYEKQYFVALRSINRIQLGHMSSCNDMLFNQIVFEQIQKFEINNKDLFQSISSFESIVLSLSRAIEQKRKLTRNRLERILSDSMADISLSKRSGEIARVVESRRKWSVNKFLKKFDYEMFKGVKIWLLTPEVVSEIIPLQIGLFDLVIFDEASQMYVEKGIPSIIRAKKVVIAGDHKQLRPSNLGGGRIELDEDLIEEDTEISAALEQESLLDLARFKYQDILLNFHYRSQFEELIAFSNYAFYKGRLYVSPNVKKPDKPPIEVIKVNDALWINRSNIQEAKEIVRLVKEVFRTRKGGETIGIITFNSSQRDLIDDLIDEECVKDPAFASTIKSEIARKENGEDIGFFVKNIESVQGDERDIIVFSIGYANNENGRLVRNYGWLSQKGGENRLNVAISRAKKKVYIVTSFNPDELPVEDARNDGPKLLKKYLQYAQAISNGDKENAQQILLSFGDQKSDGTNISFDSDFENQVYDALVEQGYIVHTQVGIGGYSIDLAITRGGKYVLGIECDGKLYHSSKSARERDYHRQKYLESRGWRIHRIWSTNWWKNPKAEIQKICTIVDCI